MLRRVLVIVLPLFVWSACGSDSSPTNASCNYALSATSATVAAAGASGSFTVTKSSGSGCSWTATPDVNWINIAPTSSSTDSTTVNYTVAQNVGGDERTGHIGVSWNGGSGSFAVTQQLGLPSQCTYTVGDSSVPSFPSAGGNGQIPVTVGGTGCGAWSAATSASWIHITSGATGTATGAIAFTVDASGASRNDKITVTFPGGSKDVVIVQGGATCSVSVIPTTQSSPAAGGSYTTSVGASCAWTATSDQPWLTISSGSSGSSNGTISYSVATSTATSARTGHINISASGASAQLTVNQACGLCASFTVSPTPCPVAPTGGGSNQLSCTFDASGSTPSNITNFEFRLVNPTTGPVLYSGSNPSVTNPTVLCGQGGLPGNGDTPVDVYLTIQSPAGNAQKVQTITFRRNSAC